MENQFVVITGATKGIGRAIADLCWSKGFDLAVCARSSDDLDQMKAAFNEKKTNEKQKFVSSVCDVSKQDQVIQFANTIHENTSFVTLLVNNAGAFVPGKLIEETDGTLLHLLNTNVMSAYWLTRQLLPLLQNQDSALITNICSIAGLHAYAPGGSYAVSKFALRGLSTTLRDELKDQNIKVTTVFPGATWSASWEGVDLPKERIMKSEDIAETVLSLLNLSPQAVVEEIVLRPQLGDL